MGRALAMAALLLTLGLAAFAWPGLRAPLWASGVTLGLAALVALPVGLLAGAYFAELAPRGRARGLARALLRALAEAPTVVVGALGLLWLGGLGGATAGLTLGLLAAPRVACEVDEALGALPPALRRAALALGATRWQVLTACTLPAVSASLGARLLRVAARVAGEAAPLLVLSGGVQGSLEGGPGLPYHVFMLAAQDIAPAEARMAGAAPALTLLALAWGLGGLALWPRARSEGVS